MPFITYFAGESGLAAIVSIKMLRGSKSLRAKLDRECPSDWLLISYIYANSSVSLCIAFLCWMGSVGSTGSMRFVIGRSGYCCGACLKHLLFERLFHFAFSAFPLFQLISKDICSEIVNK